MEMKPHILESDVGKSLPAETDLWKCVAWIKLVRQGHGVEQAAKLFPPASIESLSLTAFASC
jgi:hypothetical protein